jgi:hypothetical protein
LVPSIWARELVEEFDEPVELVKAEPEVELGLVEDPL